MTETVGPKKLGPGGNVGVLGQTMLSSGVPSERTLPGNPGRRSEELLLRLVSVPSCAPVGFLWQHLVGAS